MPNPQPTIPATPIQPPPQPIIQNPPINDPMIIQLKNSKRINLALGTILLVVISALVIITILWLRGSPNKQPVSRNDINPETSTSDSSPELTSTEANVEILNSNKSVASVTTQVVTRQILRDLVFENLSGDKAVLHVFGKSDKQFVWTRNFKIPVDFIWIDGETIVDYRENVPPAYSEEIGTEVVYYGSSVPADKLLITNKGFIKSKNIQKNDQVIVKYL